MKRLNSFLLVVLLGLFYPWLLLSQSIPISPSPMPSLLLTLESAPSSDNWEKLINLLGSSEISIQELQVICKQALALYEIQKQKFDDLKKISNDLQVYITELETKYQNLKREQELSQQELPNLKAKLEEVQKELQNSKNSLINIQQELENSKQQLAILKQQLTDSQQLLEASQKDLETQKELTRQLEISLEKVSQSLKLSEELNVRLAELLKQSAAEIEGLRKNIDALKIEMKLQFMKGLAIGGGSGFLIGGLVASLLWIFVIPR